MFILFEFTIKSEKSCQVILKVSDNQEGASSLDAPSLADFLIQVEVNLIHHDKQDGPAHWMPFAGRLPCTG